MSNKQTPVVRLAEEVVGKDGKAYIHVTCFAADGKIDIYTILKSTLSEDHLEQIMQGKRVPFKYRGHSHIKYDIEISDTIPIYIGEGEYREQTRSQLSRILDFYRSKSGSYHALSEEIKNTISGLDVYSQDVWDRAVVWSKKISELEQNGLNDPQILLPMQAFELKIELGRLFDLLKRLKEDRNRQGKENYDSFIREAWNCLREAETSTDWKAIRAQIKDIQTRLKDANMSKQQRAEVRQKLDEAFKTVNRRQDRDRDEYLAQCKRNHHDLYNRIADIKYRAKNSDDHRDLVSEAKELQQEMRDIQLTRDQRSELRGKMDEVFNIFAQGRESYRIKTEQNFRDLHTIAYNLREKARRVDDTREIRGELKDLQAQIRERKLKKDQRSQLREICDEIYEILNRKFREYLESKADRLQDKIHGLEESIARDEDFIARQQDSLANLRPGGRAAEIRSSIEANIASAEDKIRSKSEKLDNIRSSLDNLRRKLSNM